MDNTYKVWNIKRWLRDEEVVLSPDGLLMFQEKEELGSYYIDRQVKAEICRSVGIKDKNGLMLYQSDIVQTPKGTLYILTYESTVAMWEAWDFKAWAKGYYDAYIPLKDLGAIVPEDCEPPCTPCPKFYDVIKVGNTHDTPELCPEIFDKETAK